VVLPGPGDSRSASRRLVVDQLLDDGPRATAGENVSAPTMRIAADEKPDEDACHSERAAPAERERFWRITTESHRRSISAKRPSTRRMEHVVEGRVSGQSGKAEPLFSPARWMA